MSHTCKHTSRVIDDRWGVFLYVKGGIQQKWIEKEKSFSADDAGPAVHPSVSIDVHKMRPRYGGHASLMGPHYPLVRGKNCRVITKCVAVFRFFFHLLLVLAVSSVAGDIFLTSHIHNWASTVQCVSTVTNYITTSALTKTSAIPIKEVSRFFYLTSSPAIYFFSNNKNTNKQNTIFGVIVWALARFLREISLAAIQAPFYIIQSRFAGLKKK